MKRRMNMSDLSGKYAIVTGGGKGIGAAIVKRFLDDGAAGVAIFGRRLDQLQATAAECDPSGERTLCIPCDVGNRQQVKEAVAQVFEKFGRVDILVNNAGITKDRIFHKMSDEEWDAVINTNLNGTYNMCSAVYPKMREQQYGHIVNIASVSAWGNAGQANYAASKAGVMGFTRTLAKEGGPKNVIVNAILPGTIETDMLKAVPPEKYAAYTAAVPLHRLGQPSELAAVVSFLSSDDASYVTGQCITVNGGTRTS
jgi:3-oxoacyl-[acyl-carrier protein] reductase